MKTPDDPTNRALREALRRKFDDFEAQPDPSLEVSVFDRLKELGKSAATRQLLSVVLLITFVLTTTVTDDSVSMPGTNYIFLQGTLTKIPQNSVSAFIEMQTNEIESAAEDFDLKPTFKAEGTSDAFIQKLLIEPQKNISSESNVSDRTYIPTIDPISSLSCTENTVSLPIEVLSSMEKNSFAEDHSTNRKHSWKALVTVTPTNTFQMLTINPQPDVAYQNFRLPAPVSAQSIGYKISGGIEKSGFQFLLTYGQFQQTINYEIATDEFLVEPTSVNSYRVIRKGMAVENQNTFKTIGLAVNKRAVIHSGPFRHYFGNLGLEVSRELTHGQNMAWGNVGIGKELTLSPQTVLTVGPYLEYSFSKLMIPANQFQIQPYQIGISFGISYSKD